MVNVERIHEDFVRITFDKVDLGGDPSMVNVERICEDFPRFSSDSVDPGGVVNQRSTWERSIKTLQGLHLTMLILGGWLIDGQLGKDLQRHCKDYL